MILQTSSSRVLVNGDQTETFYHKRGLRQGDPLSPMLFILAVDVLQVMIQGAGQFLNNPISPKIRQPIMALQYADDTTLIANGALATLKIILPLFAKISGLEINYDKSCFIPINMTEGHSLAIGAILGCTKTEFQVTYLGMPLTVIKPSRDLYVPLIQKLD